MGMARLGSIKHSYQHVMTSFTVSLFGESLADGFL